MNPDIHLIEWAEPGDNRGGYVYFKGKNHSWNFANAYYLGSIYLKTNGKYNVTACWPASLSSTVLDTMEECCDWLLEQHFLETL